MSLVEGSKATTEPEPSRKASSTGTDESMTRSTAATKASLLASRDEVIGLPVRIFGRPVVRERLARARHEALDGIGEVLAADVVVAALDAEAVRLQQDLRVRVPRRRLEAVGGELDQQAQRVVEVDRVHEAAVLDAAVFDPAFVQALDRLREGRLRERERQVVYRARLSRRRLAAGLSTFVGEDRDQATVARIDVEVALRLVVEVRLLEDERHPEHALPEVDGRLAVRADDRDVVDALALELPHGVFLVLNESGLVFAAWQAAP